MSRTKEQDKNIMKWVENIENDIKYEEFAKEKKIDFIDNEHWDDFKIFYHKIKNKRQKTKNQHYVPQFYLRNFCNSDWKIETLKVNNFINLKPQSTRSICSWKYYYWFFTWKEDIMSQMHEYLFEQYENHFKNSYNDLVKNIKDVEPVSDQLIYELCSFVASSFLRWSWFRKQVKEFESDIMTSTYKMMHKIRKVEKVLPKELESEEFADMIEAEEFKIEDKSNRWHINFLNLDTIQEYTNMFMTKKIRFYISNWDKKFVTSENCVIEIMPLKNFENHLWNHFMERLHYFVLNPNILIEFSSPSNPWKKEKRKRINNDEVLYYNFLRSNYSEYLYSNTQDNFNKNEYFKIIKNRCEDLWKLFTSFSKIECDKLKNNI